MIVRSIKLYVTLIFSMFSMLCVAEEKNPTVIQIERDSIIYELSPKTRTAKLVDGRRTQNKRVIIPNTIRKKGKKYKVTEIGYLAFCSNTSLKSISIGDEVTRIGEWAFSGCGSLDSIIFPKRTKIDTICENALHGCYKLKYMSLPKDFYSIARNEASIIQKLWKIDHNSLKQGKYPDWFYQNEYVPLFDDYEDREEDDDNVYLDVYYVRDSMYVWLTKSTDVIEDLDSLILDNTVSGDLEGRDYGNIGQLNDTTELVGFQNYFSAQHYGHGWEGYAISLVAVSPHRMWLIQENWDIYTEICGAENAGLDEDWDWKCKYEELSDSISNRKTNGFYEIDVKNVREEEDDDGNKHVTSSSSWVLYYDGKEFVTREGETVE